MRRRCAALLLALTAAAAAADTGTAPSPAPEACVVDLAPGACVTVALAPTSGATRNVVLEPGVSACTADAIE